MSKEITIEARIDTNGKLHVTPHGTTGEECMKFLDLIKEIPGMIVREEIHHFEDGDGNVRQIESELASE